ncbi:hypothetical protein M405DRAFT_937709 [Rhizopogon salebrosus TDB-379]|nr:hypothetical protein M405DRAFT_937709 [Rhizopogon salebrosus TDB-379]
MNEEETLQPVRTVYRSTLNFTMALPLAISLCASFGCVYEPTILNVCDSSSSCSTSRTWWGIIWSCAATLFVCTWTAVHPNIPGVDEGKVAITCRRLFIMVMALFAPELIITWAARQFFSAHQAAKDFNDTPDVQLSQVQSLRGVQDESVSLTIPRPAGSKFRVWTVTHGFFAWMGGFLLYVNDEPRATLTPDELRDFVHDGSVDTPAIAEADISGRSKGDVLSKGIAILQIVWFILQIAIRYAQNLSITLLEIDTLAVVALTSIAYGWWWKKPKDVGRPCPVHWKAATPPPSRLAYEKTNISFVAGGREHYFRRFMYPFLSLMSIEPVISPRAVLARRIASLGGYTDSRGGTILLIECSSGMAFGAIHCVGWSYFFQKHTEQVLWRVASLTILCAPISTPIFYCFVVLGWFDLAELFFLIVLLAGFAYIAARLTLIVLILLSFRSLPPGAYDTVAWTKFIPHL